MISKSATINISLKTRTNLNLREKPNINSMKVKTIPEGKIVKLISSNGKWVKVVSNHDEGWLLYKYLEKFNDIKINNDDKSIDNRKRNYIGRVKTNGASLELRNDRTLDSKVIITIPNGSKVEVSHSVGNWARIMIYIKGKRYAGYVDSKYIKECSNLI